MSWFDDAFEWANDALEWWDDNTSWFNPNAQRRKQQRKIVDTGKAQYDSIDFDDPSSFDKLYDDFLLTWFQPFFDTYKKKKIREDAERWYEDYDKNSGQSWENSQYKWKDYYENGPGRYGSGSGSAAEFVGDAFEVNEAIMRLYRKW